MFICDKKARKLIVLPDQARLQLLVHFGVLLKKGARCCPVHIDSGRISGEVLKTGINTRVRDNTSLSNDELLSLLDSLRNLVNTKSFTRLDFDDDTSFSDEDYQNFTGLTRNQFNDLISNVKEIKQSKSRSVRTCVAILLVKLRCALDNKLLATLFNMKKWQVIQSFLLQNSIY